jgi:hypothetical protein
MHWDGRWPANVTLPRQFCYNLVTSRAASRAVAGMINTFNLITLYGGGAAFCLRWIPKS